MYFQAASPAFQPAAVAEQNAPPKIGKPFGHSGDDAHTRDDQDGGDVANT